MTGLVTSMKGTPFRAYSRPISLSQDQRQVPEGRGPLNHPWDAGQTNEAARLGDETEDADRSCEV